MESLGGIAERNPSIIRSIRDNTIIIEVVIPEFRGIGRTDYRNRMEHIPGVESIPQCSTSRNRMTASMNNDNSITESALVKFYSMKQLEKWCLP